MPIYHRLGNIPQRKHVVFKSETGAYYWEELYSTLGFAGIYSTLYHVSAPTRTNELREIQGPRVEEWVDAPIQAYHFFTHRAAQGGDLISARKVFLFNDDVTLATASFTELDARFYRNASADEILFVHEGSGELHTEYGVLPFRQGDYVVIPRGVMYRLEQVSPANRFFIIESNHPIETPHRFRNEFGQMLEHAPYCERDIRRPEYRAPIQDNQPATLVLKRRGRYFEYELDHHPFDVVGWDGYLYPWALSIHDYMPIVGKIHQPPPVHQVFQAAQFVVCNFVPRLYDWHEGAIPAPYFHQNVDSDEVLYYVEGNFMSRKGIESGSITLHPGDVPHGPQPGKIEESVGKKEVYEYAVMVDTFKPLKIARLVESVMDPHYYKSWLT
ncbi:MAG: homogentisate 1,2-dioxygenase [Acidobacteria bacterium]|nr:homogentisate 1,2-dioxygenase [Acidobacteriota bacterium]MCB9397021.1 homogentisate 1,2-dioxygenase [Acidobacteriota bacterium]